MQPFTKRTSALVVAGAFLLLAPVYAVTELVLHGDWAQGGVAVGYAAVVLAGIAVLCTILRVALGRRALSTLALGLLLSVVLAGSGLGGILLTNPLHFAQAYFLESNGDYVPAIHEYRLSGESAPNAPDIARSYDEWGERFLRQGNYPQALTRFTLVSTQYGQSGESVVNRAYLGTFNTYVTWVRNAGSDVPYANAINYFQFYRGLSVCDASCQATARDVEATTLYQYGVVLIDQSSFLDATERLDALLALFPNSPYAAQAHQEDAKAYLGLGKQQLTGYDCSDAVVTYQTLATRFQDTSEGQQAKVALAAPQDVIGYVPNVPNNPTPIAYLSRHANPAAFSFSDDYRASIDRHNSGAFRFKNVKQGNYNFSTVQYFSDGSTFYEWWFSVPDNNLYFVQVGPLCPTQITLKPYSH